MCRVKFYKFKNRFFHSSYIHIYLPNTLIIFFSYTNNLYIAFTINLLRVDMCCLTAFCTLFLFEINLPTFEDIFNLPQSHNIMNSVECTWCASMRIQFPILFLISIECGKLNKCSPICIYALVYLKIIIFFITIRFLSNKNFQRFQLFLYTIYLFFYNFPI